MRLCHEFPDDKPVNIGQSAVNAVVSECQAFVIGDRIWGTQFHSEFTPQIVQDLIHSLTSVLPPEVFPRRPEGRPVREWLLSTVQEAPMARRCLENFVRITEES